MLLGLALLYVGAVLFLNGLWQCDKIASREIIVINLVVAGLSFLVAVHSAILADSIDGVRAAAMTLLFAITYLWVAYNQIYDCDERGLGWFSFFVAITVLPMAVVGLGTANGLMDVWLGLCWAGWAVLWFLNFLRHVGRWPIKRVTGIITSFLGITTGWMPGLALLWGY
ncbi:AmiS/UreI family transporter [Roseovarius sp. ZX-A-9]|uniref:AmiS/UreI family transporter n=1 Tax=Roseovarius sp. ZX-A-9 TaxID=3014783 RepID=UPI002330A8F0|nr:AmiS/UreI family transporter [Roseovarius sp. ZX-A-9]